MGEYGKENARIAINTAVMYVRMVAIILISLFSARFVLRALGASDYGLYNVVGGLIAMLNFVSTAMITTTRRFINIERGKPGGDTNRIFNVCLVVHLCLAALLLILAETVGMYYIYHWLNVDAAKVGDAVFVFQVSTIVACIGVVNLPYQSLIESFEKFTLSSVVDISVNVVKLVLVILLTYYPGNALRMYALCMALITFLSFLAYRFICFRKWPEIIKWRPAGSRKEYAEVVGFNNYTAMGALAWVARSQGSTLIVNWFFGTVVNAALAVAYQLENFSVTAINRLTSAASPQITQNYSGGNMDRSLDLVYKISRYSVLLMSLLVFSIAVDVDFVLDLWLKEVPEGTASLALWTMASALIRSFMGGTQVLEQASGKIKWFQIINSIMSVVGLPIAWAAYAAGASPEAVIQVYIIYTLIYRLVEMQLLKRLIYFDIKRYMAHAYVRPAAAVALMCLWCLAYHMANVSGMEPVIRLVGIGATFLAACGSAFFIGLYPDEREAMLRLVSIKK